jgi:hypothetical protein
MAGETLLVRGVTRESRIAREMAELLSREAFLEDTEFGFYIDLVGGELRRQPATFSGEYQSIEFDESKINGETVGSYHTHPVPTMLRGWDIKPILNHRDLSRDLEEGLRFGCTGIVWHEIDWEKGEEQLFGNVVCAERRRDVPDGKVEEVLEEYGIFLEENKSGDGFGDYYGFDPEEADAMIEPAFVVKRLNISHLL